MWLTAPVITYFKITELLRALSLVDSSVYMRLCKHGCDVLDSGIGTFENYFIKAIEYFFRCYRASSKHSGAG